ncbi:MAG: 4-hydroxy-tetrahydrodipicolinate reductase [Bdellovibrionales bacterium]
MKKLNVCISGASGRMGQELKKLIESDKSLQWAAPYDRKKKTLGSSDVVVDFSLPEGFSELLAACVKSKTPLVSGTTGLTEKQKKEMEKASKQIPLLWASNMSLGVTTLKHMLKSLNQLSDYEFQIEETHHKHKKDKPSGTAITLQQSLEKAVGKKVPEPLSVRGGGVFGIHTVHVMGDEETLALTHTALNRTVFARGALIAARWLSKQKSGLYSLDDLFT